MAVSDSDLALLDDPTEWGAFSVAITPATAQAPAVWESSVVIEGMHCANCAGTVEAAVLRAPGVRPACSRRGLARPATAPPCAGRKV